MCFSGGKDSYLALRALQREGEYRVEKRVGRRFDVDFLADLPASADPCGENGEFHTFVGAGPIFSRPVPVTPGEVVERDGFVFCDLE